MRLDRISSRCRNALPRLGSPQDGQLQAETLNFGRRRADFSVTEPLIAQLSRLRAADPAAAGGVSHMFGIQQTELHAGSDCPLLFGLLVSGIRETL